MITLARNITFNIPSNIIDFNPIKVTPETSFFEILKIVSRKESYVLVNNESSNLGIITRETLIEIIANKINLFALHAKDIYQKIYYQLNSEIKDIFTIANLFSQYDYQAIAIINDDQKLEGIITPRSFCKYFIEDSFYSNIELQEINPFSLLDFPSDISIFAVSNIMNQDKLTAIRCKFSSDNNFKIITIKDILSLILKGKWITKTLGDIATNNFPIYANNNQIKTIIDTLNKDSFCLINKSLNSDNNAHNLYHEKSALKLSINNNLSELNYHNISIIKPQNLINLLTPSWQYEYLKKQNQKLSQLNTAIRIEKQQVEQEKLFSQLSYRIRQSLNLNEILAITVEEIRHFLQCDRVVIYQQYSDGDGMITAESVEDKNFSIIGKIIHDHCFAKDYIEPYLKGRIQVTNNVFAANLSPCHLDLLLSINVQANLVVPIIFHDQLWGLLAAQNCSSPRTWQQNELILLEKLASQVAIAIQQSQYAQTALTIADYQTAIASLGNAAITAKNLDELTQKTVEIVAETLKVEYCHILELLSNQAAFTLQAACGWSSQWIKSAKIGSSPRWMPGYTLKALQPVVSEDMLIETRFNPSPLLHNQGLRSGASVKIGGKDNLHGVLGIYSKKIRKFDTQEINFLQTIANVLATAIEKNRSQQQLDYFFNLSLDMFCITGTDGSFKRINTSFLTNLGYVEEDLLKQNLIDFVHPDDVEITITELEKLSYGFSSINFENRLRCKDSSYRWLAWKSLPYEEDIIYAVARDITLAKQAEEELKMLNEQLESRVKDRTQELEQTTTQLRTFVQTAGTVLIVLNQKYHILEWNEEAEKIFGWTRDSVLGEDYFLLFIPPNEREKLKELLDETISYGTIQRNIESKIITAEGDERCLLWNVNRFVDKTGEGIGIIACGQDVEEIRLAQLRLKLSEERFRSIFNQAAVGILQVSVPGKLVLVNDKFNQFLGYPAEELASIDFHQLIYVDDISDTLSDLSELLNGNRSTFQKEIRIVRHDQSLMWVNLTMSVVWVSIEPSYFIAVVNDISDRKQIEESLQKSQACLNSILNSLQDVVWSISLPEMKLRYINPVAEKFYGKSPQEIMENLSIIQTLAIEEEQPILTKIWEEILNCSKLGINDPEAKQSWELEYKIKSQPQETRWMRERTHLVYDNFGRAISIDSISTDVTEKRQAEDKLFQSLQEKEVLLKEIHHRVKNNLYVISSLLNLQSSYIQDEKVINLFQDSQNRIQTMAVIHEQLYQSDNLSHIDFAEYLNKLIVNLFSSCNSTLSNIKPIINLEHFAVDIETATPAGLLVNELVTNVFKHAFPKGNGEVKINVNKNLNQEIYLSIIDNGIGFPPDLDWQKSPSLGLRLVRLLTEQLDGDIEVITNNKGTAFHIKFRERKYDE